MGTIERPLPPLNTDERTTLEDPGDEWQVARLGQTSQLIAPEAVAQDEDDVAHALEERRVDASQR